MKPLLWRFLLTAILLGACARGNPSPGTPSAGADQPSAAITARPQAETATPAPLTQLTNGWSSVAPGGDTACAFGGKYQFFVHPGSSDRLLLYFEGGGACFNADTCRPNSGQFDPDVELSDPSDNPALKTEGVFALAEPDNPFAADTIVFISYCSGDGYLGNRKIEYTLSGQNFTIQHYGYQNTMAALNWVYQNYPQPDRATLIGCSAGTIGSAVYAPYVMERYPQTPIAVIGDSGGGFRDAPAALLTSLGTLDLLPAWLPGYQGVSVDNLPTQTFFTALALAYPANTFALLDSTDDSAQSSLLRLTGSPLSLAELIRQNLADIRQSAPNYLSYNTPGDYHCLTMRPEFYRVEVNGVKPVEWVFAIAAGQPVENVQP